MFLQSDEMDIDEMDISLEEIQGGKLCFRASINPCLKIYDWSYMIGIANGIPEEELCILLDDAIVRSGHT
jgi:hypothetical protein